MRHRIDRGPFPDALKLALARQLRRDATPMERHAWSLLRNRGILGLKFRRQHIIGGFIVDFYCPALRLILELDGASHELPEQAGYDRARSDWLVQRGYRVLRLRNHEVSREQLETRLGKLTPAGEVPLETVLGTLATRPPSPRSGGGDRGRGTTRRESGPGK